MGKVSGSDSGNLGISKKIENLENKLKKKPINITKNMWYIAQEVSGIGTVVPVICEPEGATVSVNSAEIFLNYEWQEISFHSARHLANQLLLVFSTLESVTERGRSWLVRMEATISYNEEG